MKNGKNFCLNKNENCFLTYLFCFMKTLAMMIFVYFKKCGSSFENIINVKKKKKLCEIVFLTYGI